MPCCQETISESSPWQHDLEWLKSLDFSKKPQCMSKVSKDTGKTNLCITAVAPMRHGNSWLWPLCALEQWWTSNMCCFSSDGDSLTGRRSECRSRYAVRVGACAVRVNETLWPRLQSETNSAVIVPRCSLTWDKQTNKKTTIRLHSLFYTVKQPMHHTQKNHNNKSWAEEGPSGAEYNLSLRHVLRLALAAICDCIYTHIYIYIDWEVLLQLKWLSQTYSLGKRKKFQMQDRKSVV